MPSGARTPGEPEGQNRSQALVARAGNRDAELAAIALLCLMFASPLDEPQEPQLRPAWR